MAIKARLIQAGVSVTLVAAGSLAYLWEGEVKRTYKDPVGVLTACVGSTGSDLELGQLFSDEQCTERFVKDLRVAEAAVNRCTPNVPETMKPALISFTFNVGQGRYCRSELAKLANKGDLVGACQQMYLFVKAKGVILKGLVKRRQMEAEACLKGIVVGAL